MLCIKIPVGWDRFSGRVFDGIRAPHDLWEGTAQQGPAEQQQRGGGPADVNGSSDLPLPGCGHLRVVEVYNDVVGHPAERNQHE